MSSFKHSGSFRTMKSLFKIHLLEVNIIPNTTSSMKKNYILNLIFLLHLFIINCSDETKLNQDQQPSISEDKKILGGP